MEYMIRPIDYCEYDDLINLWGRSGLTYRPHGRDSRETMQVEFQRAETAILGMYDGEKMIGAVIAAHDGRRGWINRLAIDPDCRGQGLAGQLIAESEAFLFGCGMKIIAALIEEENLPSISAFRKAGYIYGENILYFSKRTSQDV